MPVKTLLSLVKGRVAPSPRVPDGRRVYAIGDIHGRLDLVDRLITSIKADDAGRGRASTSIIFLGDLIDRGPDPRGVVDRLMRFDPQPISVRFLMGNHEEVFLKAVDGDSRALRLLIRIGGRQTILSYGIDETAYSDLTYEQLAVALRDHVPNEHIAFLSGFERWVEVGDYLFVHAGLRPGVPIEQQQPGDLSWIRDDFLTHRGSFGKTVVHGHSISEEVEIRPNRIGIDTGAFATGRLTAIGLEGDRRWFLST